MKMMKRMFALLLALMLVAGTMPVTAGAVTQTEENDLYTVEVSRFADEHGNEYTMTSLEIVEISLNEENQIVFDLNIGYLYRGLPMDYDYEIVIDNATCLEALEISKRFANESRNVFVDAKITREAQENHTGGTATCKDLAVCEVCGLEYGTTLAHSLVYTAGETVITESCALGCGHSASVSLGLSGESFVYRGEEIRPGQAVYDDAWAGERDVQIRYENNVNVGTATAQAVLGEAVLTKTFAITKAPLTIRPEDASVGYGEEAPAFTMTCEGLVGSDTEYVLTGVPEISCQYQAGDPLGTYDIVLSGEVTADNYEVTLETGTLTVVPGVPAYTAPVAATGLTYNGEAQVLLAQGAVCEDAAAEYCIWDPAKPDVYNWSEELPTARNAGTYKVACRLVGSGNYGTAMIPMVEVTIAKAKLTPKLTGSVTKVYDGTVELPEENSVELVLEGVFHENEVAVTHRITYTAADVGTKKVKVVLNPLPESVTNYELAATEAVAEIGQITPLALDETKMVIAGVKNPVYSGKEEASEITTVTMNGLAVTYDLTGNKGTNVGSYVMTLKAKGNFSGEVKVSFLITPDEKLIQDSTGKALTVGTVTSANKENVDKAVKMMKDADLTDIDAATKAAWEAIGTTANALQEQLKKAADAAATTDITKAKAITADKAKDTDKTVLTDAKEDLEDALETYATNYTKAERDAMEKEIDRLEDIIADITAAADTIAAIKALTENSTKAKVEAAQAKYDALTAAQKKIVDNSTDGKLDKMQGLVGNYKITSGDGKRWSKKSGGVLTFTCNGPLSKFTGIRVDGKAVLSKHYTYKEGSTIVTLKSSYLEGLSLGNHTITFRYEDGDTSATFTVQKEAVTPSTGDQSNVGLWAGIGGGSLVLLMALLVIMKKKMK